MTARQQISAYLRTHEEPRVEPVKPRGYDSRASLARNGIQPYASRHSAEEYVRPACLDTTC